MRAPLLAILALLALAGCPSRHPPGWVGVDTAASCEAACANLARLGCEEGKPTPRGATCIEVCQHGKTIEYLPPPTTCLASAATCAVAAACK